MTTFEEAVVKVVASIEAGEVLTYGEVAEEAGYPGAARAVGNLLRRTEANIPWWRVVGHGGRLRAPSRQTQARLLGEDGLLVMGGRLIG